MNQLSRKAQDFRHRVEDEARFLETCDGGYAGTPEQPSIWVLGIEPGWSLADGVAAAQEGARRQAEMERYSVELQLKWPYNRNVFKLLAALDGLPVEDYVQFAERKRPFELGSVGYFKGNLFPEPFNNVERWDEEAAESTGFATKSDYRDWQRRVRFAVMRAWIARCRPKLLVGVGLTHLHDFLAITGTVEAPAGQRFEVNGHGKTVYVTNTGIVPVAVIPHLSGGPNGLNSNEAIRVASTIIASVTSS